MDRFSSHIPIEIIASPILPKIRARNIRGRNLKDNTESTGRYHVAGVVRYIFKSKTPSPIPRNVVPNMINRNQRLTPRPGVSQAENLLISSRACLYQGNDFWIMANKYDSSIYRSRQRFEFIQSCVLRSPGRKIYLNVQCPCTLTRHVDCHLSLAIGMEYPLGSCAIVGWRADPERGNVEFITSTLQVS